MRTLILRIALPAVLAFSFGQSAQADVKVHGLFTDGMVLQQGIKAPIWGTAQPDEKITIELNLGTAKIEARPTQASAEGKWRTELPDLKAGGPFQLTISGTNKVVLKDVYVGEVWICSGQSNMEMSLSACAGAADAIKASRNKHIRLFTVPRHEALKPESGVVGRWVECGPDSAGGFSAVGYYFGRDLYKALNVPIGLIHSSWGGTACEQWTREEVLNAHPEHKNKVAGQCKLYNAMIAPLIPFAIRGVIWYQGESNAGRAELYRSAFPLMIKNWRDDWKQGDFPFLFVQLAPYQKIDKAPADTPWARLRDAQLAALKLPNTGMAVITDVGEENDIHPPRKEPVGARLALAARAIAYGEKITHSGPLFDSMKVVAGKAVLSFKHVGKGLEARSGELTGFTIAGKDGKFVTAQAEIKEGQVIVSSAAVKEPAAVRYGWANYPVVNLWNKDGLPASPFRTDDWPVGGPPSP